jgi:SAM-dependent methyltransferase
MSKYFLPDDYQFNTPITHDSSSGTEYWSLSRIAQSKLYQRALYLKAVDICAKYSIKNVADLGCGSGHKLALLNLAHPDLSLTGFDQESAIEYCKKIHCYGKWVAVNFDEGIDINERFDLVISSDVIEHLSEPDKYLETLKSILVPNGYILLSTPERNRLRGRLNRCAPNKSHVQEWNFEELEIFVKSKGFEVVEHVIQPAIGFSASSFYFKKLFKRLMRLKTLNYNQVILIRA